MVDEKQVKKWLKEGTITQAQANKMLADSSKNDSDEKSNKFIGISATIGAILIFIGFAWLIAKNWHQIPNAIKIFILVCATLGAFISGVMLKQNNQERVGRSLIALGALLFILSLFLISQIYNLAISSQHYSWLLLFSWIIILITAYLLDSSENLVISMVTFFPWVIMQYNSSISNPFFSSPEGTIFGFILIFLSAGALLFGLSTLHNSLNHKFTNIYRFWTVFYFLAIFYLLSFQSFLPIISEYAFEKGAFSIFLIIFLVMCFFGFIIGAILAASRNPSSLKEILGFIGILAILFILILSTKSGAGLVGYCHAKNCYEYRTESECTSAPNSLSCKWEIDQWSSQSTCQQASCYGYRTEAECNSKTDKLECNWINESNYCQQISFDNSIYETCNKNNNQKNNCVENSLCNWQPSYGFGSTSEGLPASLWILWIINNIVFLGFILLILWYGQLIGSTKIVNITLSAFILDVITRYIGFWINLRGYFAFSILAIFGGLMLILGAWLIPKWRRKLLEKINK